MCSSALFEAMQKCTRPNSVLAQYVPEESELECEYEYEYEYEYEDEDENEDEDDEPSDVSDGISSVVISVTATIAK